MSESLDPAMIAAVVDILRRRGNLVLERTDPKLAEAAAFEAAIYAEDAEFATRVLAAADVPALVARVRSQNDAIRGLLDAMWSCNACGPHPGSTSRWCDGGCGSDYNRMTQPKRTMAQSRKREIERVLGEQSPTPQPEARCGVEVAPGSPCLRPSGHKEAHSTAPQPEARQ